MNIRLLKYSKEKMYEYTVTGGGANRYYSDYGQVGGKLKHSLLKADTEGKIHTILEKKMRAGWCYTEDEAIQESYKILRERVQKIGTWEKDKDKVVYPCYASIKLDGVAFHTMDDGHVYSRENNILIEDACDIPWAQGELYVPGKPLNEIVHIVRNPELHGYLQYRFFDLKIPRLPYDERLVRLGFLGVKVVPHRICISEEDIDVFYEEAVEAGEEGVVVREIKGKYKGGTRSHTDIKRKPVNSEEFKILSVLPESKGDKIMAIFQCTTEDGKVFKAKPTGTHESRMEIYENQEEYVGEMITVEFRGYTAYGVPNHAVALPVVRSTYE